MCYVDDAKNNAIGRYFSEQYCEAFGDSGIAQHGEGLNKLPWVAVRPCHGRGSITTRSSCWFDEKPCECSYKYGHKRWKANPMPDWKSHTGKVLCDVLEAFHKSVNSCNASM